jgi:hypothetical protein
MIAKGRRVAREAGASLVFEQFAEQFLDLGLCGDERAPAYRRRPVDPTRVAAVAVFGRLQVALRLERVKNRIQSACADTVAVPGQLFYHPQAKNRALLRVMQKMKANQAGIEISVVSCQIGWVATPLINTRRHAPKANLAATARL